MDSIKKKVLKIAKKGLRVLSISNLVFAVVFLVLLFVVSESWWLGVVATYSPRVFALAPTLVLFPLVVFIDRWSLALNIISALLIAFIAMEFNIPWKSFSTRKPGIEGDSALRVVTCNVQVFQPDFADALREIQSLKPDLVVLQETEPKNEALTQAFSDFHIARHHEYWVGCRYPVRMVGRRRTSGFNRVSMVAFEIDHPDQQLILFNLHPKTVQFGLRYLIESENPNLQQFRKGINQLRDYQLRRIAVQKEMRAFVDEVSNGRPVIIAGDFNVPQSSGIFRNSWRGFTDVFTAAGWGYGYTVPCDGPGTMPPGWPWIRIDHILVNDSWTVSSSKVGNSNGSDHRLVTADLILQNSAPKNQ